MKTLILSFKNFVKDVLDHIKGVLFFRIADFQITDPDFILVEINPNIEKPLGKKSEDSFLVCVFLRKINFFFQGKKNRKQPFTVGINNFFFPEEHIQKRSRLCFFHDKIKGRKIFRMLLSENCSGLYQIGLIMVGGILFPKVVIISKIIGSSNHKVILSHQ